jgi:hypothetical protein
VLVDDRIGRAADLHAIAHVVGRQLRGRGQHDRAELHRGEHRVPQLDAVRQHQQNPVAAHDADAAQPVRDPRRALDICANEYGSPVPVAASTIHSARRCRAPSGRNNRAPS